MRRNVNRNGFNAGKMYALQRVTTQWSPSYFSSLDFAYEYVKCDASLWIVVHIDACVVIVRCLNSFIHLASQRTHPLVDDLYTALDYANDKPTGFVVPVSSGFVDIGEIEVT